MTQLLALAAGLAHRYNLQQPPHSAFRSGKSILPAQRIFSISLQRICSIFFLLDTLHFRDFFVVDW